MQCAACLSVKNTDDGTMLVSEPAILVRGVRVKGVPMLLRKLTYPERTPFPSHKEDKEERW